MRISWSGSKPSVPLREGRALCSTRDPLSEARQWVSRQQIEQPLVFLIGHGSGFHVKKLREFAPQARIVTVDINAELSPDICLPEWAPAEDVWKIVEPVLKEGFQVLRFRPAWSGAETQFQRLEDLFCGRCAHDGSHLPYLGDDHPLSRRSKAQYALWELIR